MHRGKFDRWFQSSMKRERHSHVLSVGVEFAALNHPSPFGWSLSLEFLRSDFESYGKFTVNLLHEGEVHVVEVDGSWRRKAQIQSVTLLTRMSDKRRSHVEISFVPETNTTSVVLHRLNVFPSS